MMKSQKLSNLYKLIGLIVIMFVMVKVKGQLATLKKYNAEI